MKVLNIHEVGDVRLDDYELPEAGPTGGAGCRIDEATCVGRPRFAYHRFGHYRFAEEAAPLFGLVSEVKAGSRETVALVAFADDRAILVRLGIGGGGHLHAIQSIGADSGVPVRRLLCRRGRSPQGQGQSERRNGSRNNRVKFSMNAGVERARSLG